MMPVLFAQGATTFTTNGLGTLSDCISCVVTEERNGEYTMEMEYPVDGVLYDQIAPSSIIRVNCGEARGQQAFRVYRVSRPIGGKVTISATHISYQLSHIPCAPFSASSASAALAGLKSHAAEDCPFTFYTNKSTTANYNQTTPASIRSRLGGVQGSILDVYGGEFEFNNYRVNLWASRGSNRGVTLRYGKNIVDLTQEVNIENTYTGVYPYWADDSGNYVELPEKIVSAPSAANFPYPRTVILDCSGDFDEAPTAAQLRATANSYISKAGVGVPSVSITVSFVNLRDTEEYADVAALERVELCDTLTVVYEKLGVNTTAKVVRTAWDALAERYQSIEVGDIKASLAGTIATLSEESEDVVTMADVGSAVTAAVQTATDLITGVGGGYVRLNRDANGNPYELLIMDTKDITTATKVWRFNQNGWGYSSNGYNGTYKMAATINGGIVADYITAGTLTGLTINNGNGTFHVTSDGKVTATAGKIANWTIGTNQLRRESTDGSRFAMVQAPISDPATTNNIAFAVGAVSGGTTTYPFEVDYDGTVKMTKAEITTGNATIKNGTISGASITNPSMSGGSVNNTTITNGSATALSVNNGAFSVTYDGVITSTAGNIGGWSITSRYLEKYNNGDEPNSTAWAAIGAPENPVGTDIAFAIYTRESTSDTWDYPFRVNYDGSLIATKATITGEITSTSGKIANWTIAGGSLYRDSSDGLRRAMIQAATSDPQAGYLAFAIGKRTTASGSWDYSNFRVNYDGTLHCKNADIEGTITSASATITGGSINMNTSSEDSDLIKLNYSSWSTSMTPSGFSVRSSTGHATYGSSGVFGYNTSNDNILTLQPHLLKLVGTSSAPSIILGDADGQHMRILKQAIEMYDSNNKRRAYLSYTAGLTFYKADGTTVSKSYPAS